MKFFFVADGGEENEVVQGPEYHLRVLQNRAVKGQSRLNISIAGAHFYDSEEAYARIWIGTSSLPQIRCLANDNIREPIKIALAGFDHVGGKVVEVRNVENSVDRGEVFHLRPGDVIFHGAEETRLRVVCRSKEPKTGKSNAKEDVQIDSSVPQRQLEVGNSVDHLMHGGPDNYSSNPQSKPHKMDLDSTARTPRPSRTRPTEMVKETPPTKSSKKHFDALPPSSIADNSVYGTAPNGCSSLDTNPAQQANGASTKKSAKHHINSTDAGDMTVLGSESIKSGHEPQVRQSETIESRDACEEKSGQMKANKQMPKDDMGEEENDDTLVADQPPEAGTDEKRHEDATESEPEDWNQDEDVVMTTETILDEKNAKMQGQSPSLLTDSRKRKELPDSDKRPGRTYGKRRKVQLEPEQQQELEPSNDSAQSSKKVTPSTTLKTRGKPQAVVEISVKGPSGTPDNIKTPASKTRSTPGAKNGDEKRLEIVLTGSSVSEKFPNLFKFVKQQCNIKDVVTESTDVLCVGGKEVKTTSKMLLAIVLGKRIVSDDWITASGKRKCILDPGDYTFKDSKFAREHGRSLADVYSNPLPALFERKSVYMTPDLKKDYKSGYKDIENILQKAGAKKVISSSAKDVTTIVGKNGQIEDMIILGTGNEDPQLQKFQDDEVICYHKDLLSSSIFAGELQLDNDELKLKSAPRKQRLTRLSK